MNMIIYNKWIQKSVENSANFVSLITFSPKLWPPSRGSWSTIWDPLLYRNEQLIILPQENIPVHIRYTAKYIPALHTMIHFYNPITVIIKRRKKRNRIPATILLRDQYVLYPPLFELVFIPFYFNSFPPNPFLFIKTVTSITYIYIYIPYYMVSTRSQTEPIFFIYFRSTFARIFS